MAETLAILSLLALLTAFGMFCHGLFARARMKRYKRTPVQPHHSRPG